MPSRILRDYRDSVTMANLTDFQERLFIRMIMTADDFGRGLANNLHATCFQVSDIPRATVMQAAHELQNVGLVRLYADQEGRVFFDIPKFGNKPRAKHSKCPPYEECKQVASKLHADCEQLPADCTSKPRTENRYSETENREPKTESCAEPGIPASTPEASAVVLWFDCTGTKDKWPLTEKQVEDWQLIFPSIEVLAECRHAQAWESANPAKRKTASGKPRFLLSWLKRQQDSGKGKRAAPGETRNTDHEAF